MNAITYTEARENLEKHSAGVPRSRSCNYHAEAEDSVVMISLEDYESLTETAYLLRNPKNARRLLASVGELEQGQGCERKLHE